MFKHITNAKIVTPDKIIQGDIAIDQNGKISAVGSDTKGEVFDAKGMYVLPGLIEVHGHMREPGLGQKEDVPHGTSAAIAGGFTTIIDMPNTVPPTTTIERLEEKIEHVYANRSHSDYAFFMGASKDDLGELEKVDPGKIVGVKIFMAGHETTPTTIPDDEMLEKIFMILAKRNLIAAVHAEDQALIHGFENEFKKTGRNDPALWSQLRPKEVVVKAVQRAIALAQKHNVKLYLLHLSTAGEFALIDAAREKLNIHGEVASYQLTFNTSDYDRLGNKVKVSPALRSESEQDTLWQLLKQGKVDVICSEHTPHEKSLKEQNDVWKAPSGMPSIQETLPALITGWVKRFGKENIEEGLQTIAKLSSQNPAKIFGFHSKGEITIGKDADLVVIDPESVWEVKKEDLFTKCGWSAYEGLKLLGRPTATFLRGELVYNNGRILGEPTGKWLQ